MAKKHLVECLSWLPCKRDFISFTILENSKETYYPTEFEVVRGHTFEFIMLLTLFWTRRGGGGGGGGAAGFFNTALKTIRFKKLELCHLVLTYSTSFQIVLDNQEC